MNQQLRRLAIKVTKDYITTVLGLLTLGLTPVAPGEFSENLWRAVTWSLAPAVVSLLRYSGDILETLEEEIDRVPHG